MTNKARIGSISHGTLRTGDLLEAFASELDWLAGDSNADHAKLVQEAEGCDQPEEADELVQELHDALNEYAPPYCYFGAHIGDGSDFGFWPCMDQIEELPRVEDSDEAKALGEDCIFVNDHGNVTVFGGDGSIIIDFV